MISGFDDLSRNALCYSNHQSPTTGPQPHHHPKSTGPIASNTHQLPTANSLRPFESLLLGHGRESPGDWPGRKVRREGEEIKQTCLEGWGGRICMHTDNVFHRAAMQIAVRPNGTLDWLNKCNLCLCRTVSLNFLRLHFPAQTCAVTSLLVLLLLLLPLVLALLLLLLLLLLPIPCSPNFESQNTRQQGAPPVFHHPILMIFKPWASQSSQLSHLFLQLCL